MLKTIYSNSKRKKRLIYKISVRMWRWGTECNSNKCNITISIAVKKLTFV